MIFLFFTAIYNTCDKHFKLDHVETIQLNTHLHATIQNVQFLCFHGTLCYMHQTLPSGPSNRKDLQIQKVFNVFNVTGHVFWRSSGETPLRA